VSAPDDAYAEAAIAQLDAIEAGADVHLYLAVLDGIDLIFERPREAQRRSTAFTSKDGIVPCLPVVGYPPYKVFWVSDGPRIEAVFPHP
jgi:hypothetical protein